MLKAGVVDVVIWENSHKAAVQSENYKLIGVYDINANCLMK